MSKHAVLSPSSAVRWLACPGSVVLSPEGGKGSRAAAEGSVMHEMAAAILEGRCEPQGYLGLTLFHDDFGFEVDQDMIDDVMLYVDEARDAIGDHAFMVEVSVPIEHLTGEKDARGTADLVILRPREIEVRDAKFGRGVEVDAEDNPQTVMYALGVLEELDAVLGEIDTVRLTIHQPRLAGPKEWVLTIDELRAWTPKIAEGAARVELARALGDNATDQYNAGNLVPTNAGCKFCPARATCPKLREETTRDVLADFDDLSKAEPDQLAADLERVERVEAWCKAIRAEVERRLFAGTPVLGWKLVAGRAGARKWKDEDAAAAALEAQIGPDAWERKLISPAKCDKLKVQVGDLVTQTPGKPSVARERDRRPELKLDSSAEFDNLDDGDGE